MKRPIPIYLITIWGFIVFNAQTQRLAQIAEPYLSDGRDTNHLWQIFRGLILILFVWQVVGLIQLKPFNRWLAVGSFIWATIGPIWIILSTITRQETHLRLVVVSALYATLSLASILYLTDRSFRDYAVQFVTEREKQKKSRMMQEISQKKILDGFRK